MRWGEVRGGVRLAILHVPLRGLIAGLSSFEIGSGLFSNGNLPEADAAALRAVQLDG
jgi:hypothetical protein